MTFIHWEKTVLREQPMMSRIGNNNNGFTLIEVMLSVVIFTMGVIAVIRAYATSLNALQASQNYIYGVCLAKEKLAEIQQSEMENAGVSQGNDQGEFPGQWNRFQWKSQISATNEKGLNAVKITVFNAQTQPVREFSLASYVENKK